MFLRNLLIAGLMLPTLALAQDTGTAAESVAAEPVATEPAPRVHCTPIWATSSSS